MSTKLTIPLTRKMDRKELKKIIGFASEDIETFDIHDKNINVYVNEGANVEQILDNLNALIGRFIVVDEKESIVFSQERLNEYYIAPETIYESGLVKNMGLGLVGLNKESVALFDYFDAQFSEIARRLSCEEKKYPVLLPMETYKKTGYLKKSPQYSIFCCEPEENIRNLKGIDAANSILEMLKDPTSALSPSACFHVYEDIEGSELSSPVAITLKQDVFRNEGRFNYEEFGRLKSYTVREIVFIGNEAYVKAQLSEAQDMIIQFLHTIGVSSSIVSSSDAFIVPELQKIKEIQLNEKSKYEVRVNVNEEDSLACASLNFHGISFSKPFQFGLAEEKHTVSGCIGFGLERWVLAFLSQYGCEMKDWPQQIKNAAKNINNSSIE